MIDDDSEKIITDIFGWHSGWAADEIWPVKLSPGFPDIKAFAGLLATDPSEEELQIFIENHPQILTGLCGQGDDATLGVLTKPSVGTKFKADFAVLTSNQGGSGLCLIELERSTHPLYTKKGTPSRFLQQALGQTDDWADWIAPNRSTFVRDTIDALKSAPLYPKRSRDGSFRLFSPQQIEKMWTVFGGFEDSHIHYKVIIGRWSQLSEAHQKRLISNNRRQNRISVLTYEQLARRAYDRPACFP